MRRSYGKRKEYTKEIEQTKSGHMVKELTGRSFSSGRKERAIGDFQPMSGWGEGM